MKLISTLFTASAVFLTMQASAQYTQNFESASSLTTGCAIATAVATTTIPGEVITGTGSLFSNPPVNGSGTRDFATPYLDMANADPLAIETFLTVSFNYKLNE